MNCSMNNVTEGESELQFGLQILFCRQEDKFVLVWYGLFTDKRDNKDNISSQLYIKTS